MNEQIPAPVEASIEEDTHGREQRSFFEVGFWTVIGGIALAPNNFPKGDACPERRTIRTRHESLRVTRSRNTLVVAASTNDIG
ncbi:hypothetical protein [Pseudoclavibacter terrae]|uniref:hypothetical protein n=1 Tax=Pseudoclavibacter terrae TaxID=1530195 RepID=UPI00232EB40C|nr:hypothetical protein [Pseudoclavibacter terrae]